MNVFEDLIAELKEENLLERTITEMANGAEEDDFFSSPPPELENRISFDQLPQSQITDSTEDILNEPILEASHDVNPESATPYPQPVSDPADVPDIAKPQNAREFLRKRAMEEVTSLQMVGHVLSGVEREYMRAVPVPFDDLAAKKALHKFLQSTDDPKSEECSDAEYALLQETQKWYSVLAERDLTISVANVRRFCENSRPALSSQALIALSRFYRNSPFSETVRGKFDFVMTRLFSRETEDNKRRLLFANADMVGHIKTLYDNWSSINLFNFEENISEFSSAVKNFQEFAAEAENAPGLDELLKTNIFDRVRQFKEDLGEMFFVPDILSAAIDMNLRLGNRFMELADEVRSKVNLAKLEEKYGTTLDELVSNTTGKTVLFTELFDPADAGTNAEDNKLAAKDLNQQTNEKATKKTRQWLTFNLFGVNKWLLSATILVVLISTGVFVWADRMGPDATAAEPAAAVELDGSGLTEIISAARTTDQVFYGMVQPGWDSFTDEQKIDSLKRVSSFASQKGLNRVNLLNKKGRTVGYAVGERYEILNPTS